MKRALDVAIVVLTVAMLVCVFAARVGDNPDARALAHLAYLPASIFALLDLGVVVWRLKA